MVLFLPLLFAFALGILGLLFRIWVFKRGFDPAVALGAFGVVLLTVAFFTYVQAMRTACHGAFDVFKNASACTRSAQR